MMCESNKGTRASRGDSAAPHRFTGNDRGDTEDSQTLKVKDDTSAQRTERGEIGDDAKQSDSLRPMNALEVERLPRAAKSAQRQVSRK